MTKPVEQQPQQTQPIKKPKKKPGRPPGKGRWHLRSQHRDVMLPGEVLTVLDEIPAGERSNILADACFHYPEFREALIARFPYLDPEYKKEPS